MTLSEYRLLAQRTASTINLEDKQGHGSLGLIGEAGEIIDIVKKQKYMGLTDELFREKLIDEAGDVMWYVAEVCTGFSYNIEDLNVVLTPKDYEVGIYEDNESCALKLIEQATRCAVSRKSVTHFVYLREVVSHLAILLVKAGIDIQEVLRHNIDKLRDRYPDGFSAERSNGRYQH